VVGEVARTAYRSAEACRKVSGVTVDWPVSASLTTTWLSAGV
jgi:hypothetical protein